MKKLLLLLLLIPNLVMADIIYLNCNEEVMIGRGLYDDYYGKKRSTIYRYDNIKKRIKSTSYYPLIPNELACDEYETDLNCVDESVKGRYERIYLNRITLEIKHYFHKQSERDEMDTLIEESFGLGYTMDMWESKGKCDIENKKL
jgi:hypothetical protein